MMNLKFYDDRVKVLGDAPDLNDNFKSEYSNLMMNFLQERESDEETYFGILESLKYFAYITTHITDYDMTNKLIKYYVQSTIADISYMSCLSNEEIIDRFIKYCPEITSMVKYINEYYSTIEF